MMQGEGVTRFVDETKQTIFVHIIFNDQQFL